MNLAVKTSKSQLRWRCRRGMLELDLLLNNFMELEYNQLVLHDIECFSELLDFSDQDLLDLLLSKTASSEAGISNMVARIRRACIDGGNHVK